MLPHIRPVSKENLHIHKKFIPKNFSCYFILITFIAYFMLPYNSKVTFNNNIYLCIFSKYL